MTVSFAGLDHRTICFDPEIKAHALTLKLIDSAWMQRLRDVRQTANTKLVYMFSEHSRFGHSLGVASLADLILKKLGQNHLLSKDLLDQIQYYRPAITAAALLHDIGHLAPGSHIAFKCWFPQLPDTHEEIGVRIIREDQSLQNLIAGHGEELVETICNILQESDQVPSWCWQIISGGGWNADRGDWCTIDSILAGVSYGKYNVDALTDSITITSEGRLALLENRLDAMLHFAVSRHAMYRQIYQHRVLLVADALTKIIVQRARECVHSLPFKDEVMAEVLQAKDPNQLQLKTIFGMRESWWNYHLIRWTQSQDKVLADLSDRLLNRRLLKTIRLPEIEFQAAFIREASGACLKQGYDPTYYLHKLSTVDTHGKDGSTPLVVQMEDGHKQSLSASDPLFEALSQTTRRQWIAVPDSVKQLLKKQASNEGI